MKKFHKTMLALAVASAGSLTSHVAYAQSNTIGCTCISEASVNAKVTEANGEVIHSDVNGYSLAKPGSVLVPGSLVSVGFKSSAEVAFGDQCSINLEANSELLLGTQDGKVCAQVTSTDSLQSNVLAYSSDPNQGAKEAISQLNASANLDTTQAQRVFNGTGLPSELVFFGLSGTFLGFTIAEGVDDDNGGAAPATP